ncbi:MAG: M4 family metallopeptidase [Saprospiraceae bacterium]|nr:M4 family metallopeptidase [Saprospiraceae bacterium]
MKIFSTFFVLILYFQADAQLGKHRYVFSNPGNPIVKKVLKKREIPSKVIPLSYLPAAVQISSNHPRIIKSKPGSGIQIIDINSDGIPSALMIKKAAFNIDLLNSQSASESLNGLLGIKNDNDGSFKINDHITDDQGNQHFRYVQLYKNLPVLDAEFIIHKYTDGSLFMNGQAYNLPAKLNDIPSVQENQLIEICDSYFSKEIIKVNDPLLQAISKMGISRKTLGVWKDLNSEWKLIYFVKYRPTLRRYYELYIDAHSGEILKVLNSVCNCSAESHCINDHTMSPQGAETASAQDLFNNNQTIQVWKEGSTYYLMDASRTMFNAAKSKFPDNPVGVIVTLDAKNRNVEGNSFQVEYIANANNQWPSKTAVSAHLNASKAYEYFKQTHSRNSINGTGGNILSIINVNDGGGQMDNAFWNGEAMFYGNGKSAFSPLAKGLDVAGHEMSHGVIGSSANLVYENEPGAINESFADIFGAMIDRDDWKIGEDVVNKNVFKSGALRSLEDPHNGGTSLNTPGWQPKHVNEQYKGTDDNGGVHINSGIPNHAFYVFVIELAKSSNLSNAQKIAEKVYYHALTKFLTRSSNFKDLRVAIEKCAMDLFPNNPEVLTSVKTGFDRVGIGGTTNTPTNRVLPTNPGKEFVVCTDLNKQGLYLYDFNTVIQLTTRAINSKPSVTDNGSEIYYVGADKKLYLLVRNGNGSYVEQILDDQPVYRNVVISKDGRLLGVVFDIAENLIHVFDFVKQQWGDFKLYNPSYSNTSTGDVNYSDVMDFDHSGQYIMYDAFNTLKNSAGQNYEYWDIGFLNVFDNQTSTFASGKIDKLVSGLPENVAIGNPVFSKNSLDVIAFDYIEDLNFFGTDYTLVGGNIETGTFETIISDRPDLSYPNFSVKDNFVLFDGLDSNQDGSLNVIGLNADKISSSGNEQVLLKSGKWGAWFATGSRKLTIGVQNISENRAVHVYPNPFEDYLQIQIKQTSDGIANLEILNAMGQNVYNEKIKFTADLFKHSINLSQLNGGVYYLQIRTDKDILGTVKLVRE